MQELQVANRAAEMNRLTTPFRLGNPRLAMARVPTLPDRGPGLDAADEPVVAEGMFLSSQVHADTSPQRTGRRRTTARAYSIRARRRTTPQGVFAAVAGLEFTNSADCRTGLSVEGVRTRTYPSPAWLHQVLDHVLDSPAVLHGLTFTANNLVVRRGERLEVEHPCDDARTGPQRRSIRATEVPGST